MNERQYKVNLAELEANNPGEPLLSTLRGGWSEINVLYMGVALKRMPTVLEDEGAWDGPGEAESPKGIITALNKGAITPDDVLRGLWAERTRLFGMMNKQSNLFHTCKTDEERDLNSKKVLRWWADILAAKAKIEYYEQHGELPKTEDEEDELSANPALLAKQLNSIRARISQTQKKISDLAGLDPKTPGKESKIADAEASLRNLKHLKGMAEQKMKFHEQEA